MFSVRGPKLSIFASVLAVIALVFGFYTTFIQSRGFEKTTATILSVEETEESIALDDDDNRDYDVTVEYTVDGKTYTGLLDFFSPSFAPGKTVTVRYDPNNPSVIHGGQGFGIYLMAVGAAILAIAIFSAVRTKKKNAAVAQQQERSGAAGYPAPDPGEEREVYFLTDRGTAKYGHRMEDAERRVLFEAKMTKFSLMTPYEFDFIDHEHQKTTPHTVGHEESSEWNALLLDNHYTFTFDGQDIWKHLKQNGIRVESSYGAGGGKLVGVNYRIFRDDEELARAESTSIYVHEEDAEARGKLGKLVPAQGYYRVWTRERNLELLFVTLLAFARSGASDDRGGNFQTIANTVKKRPQK